MAGIVSIAGACGGAGDSGSAGITPKAHLYIFSGLPGVGKSTLARQLAQKLSAVYLRIDTIEQAIRDSNGPIDGPEGYVIAYGLAAENLRLGLSVVADSVNPIEITRSAWRNVAIKADAAYIEIEVICSDAGEHRSRVETRTSEIRNLRPPTWDEVQAHEYHAWESNIVRIDTAGKSSNVCFAELLKSIAETAKRYAAFSFVSNSRIPASSALFS